MTDTQALRDLLVKVEAGWPPDIDTPYMTPFHAVWPDWRAQSAWLANNGSLDAAKALHDAVLPGWLWFAGHLDGVELGFVCTVSNEPFSDAISFRGFSSTPASAWLICILRALIAQATP